jgi:formylglycine-generating enzyme required for sulfatase activity
MTYREKACLAGLALLVGCGGAATVPPGAVAKAGAAASPAAAAQSPSAPDIVTSSDSTASAAEAAPAPAKPLVGPSCDGRTGAGNDCGSGESCCARALLPEGDVLYRKLDAGAGEKKHVHAFYLDKFETTVGRFRAWVAAGQPLPKAGEALYDDGEGHVVKWSDKAKAQDAAHLEGGWKRYDTWSAGNDRLPKNNITWYTAAAFCKWDGGHLPTDVQWTHASRGGAEDRPYPWGAESPTPEYAVYNCLGDGNQSCSMADILPVGSRPKGASRWGNYDLAGSMFEWTLSAGTLAGPDTVEKARGGGFCYIGGVDRRATTDLRPAVFREDSPDTVSHMTGVRCAYEAPAGAARPNEQAPSTGGGRAVSAR